MEKLKRAQAVLAGTAAKYQEFKALTERRRINRERQKQKRETAKQRQLQLEKMLEVALKSVEISQDQLALFGL